MPKILLLFLSFTLSFSSCDLLLLNEDDNSPTPIERLWVKESTVTLQNPLISTEDLLPISIVYKLRINSDTSYSYPSQFFLSIELKGMENFLDSFGNPRYYKTIETFVINGTYNITEQNEWDGSFVLNGEIIRNTTDNLIRTLNGTVLSTVFQTTVDYRLTYINNVDFIFMDDFLKYYIDINYSKSLIKDGLIYSMRAKNTFF